MTLPWPKDLKASDLRAWVKDQLCLHGAPLRWAITAVHHLGQDHGAVLQIEAVLIE
ncbi:MULTISPECIES: hypothetical protein [unclassified Synechococcus]|uniref:hypothetical protein n=1 Tax=unclassified Synechococcus TaxID=2626047 RepID=UPI001FDF30FF|nr:hypothetical protein [Synechococcus sp. WH 8020]